MNWDFQLTAVCQQHMLDRRLVAAQIRVESANVPWAWNPEPRYRYFWDVKKNKPFRAVSTDEVSSEVAPSDFPALVGDHDQEWWAQQASWGLMQIMGALARELGFAGPFLTELCDPILNLSIGCTHLAKLSDWALGDMEQALAAYNGGKLGNSIRPFRNQAYVDKVLKARI